MRTIMDIKQSLESLNQRYHNMNCKKEAPTFHASGRFLLLICSNKPSTHEANNLFGSADYNQHVFE